MSRAFVWSVGLFVCCVVVDAWAADVQRAVQLYREGFVAYSQNQYEKAITNFQEARRLLPSIKRYDKTRTELDRLIGMSYYKLRKFREAYNLLDAYLRSTSRRKNRVAGVRKVWLELRSRLGIRESQPVVRRRILPPRRRPVVRRKVVITPPTPPPAGRSPHPVAWAMTGVGVVTLGAAIVVGVVAQQNMNSVTDRFVRLQDSPERNAQSISLGAREAITQSTLANALYIGGGVLTATGTILLFTWKTSSPPAR